jgi:hypothetical protein
MSKDHPTPTDEEIKAIAARRAESLKRVQELNAKKGTKNFGGDKAGGKGKQAPPKGRNFRHQGR